MFAVRRLTSKRVLGSLLGLALLAAGAWVAFRSCQSDSTAWNETARASGSGSAETDVAANGGPSTAQADGSGAPEVGSRSTRQAGAAHSAAPARVWSEPSPETRQLVTVLAGLDLSQGAISKEQADQWKQSREALVVYGPAAVPAIHEFLARNQEVTFAGMDGAALLGQRSLRSALINALGQIGGPD